MVQLASHAQNIHVLENYPRNSTVHDLFKSYVLNTPDAPAVFHGSKSFSYSELDELATKISWHLSEAGVKQNDIVMLLCGRGADTIAAMLAILKLGAIFAPVDPSYPAQQIISMVEDCQPRLLLWDNHAAGLIEELQSPCETMGRAHLPALIGEAVPAIHGEHLCDTGTADDIAYAMFTSGSTGRPKGVLVRHRGIVRLVRAQNYARFANDEIFLHMAPLAFDASTLEIWGPLLNGGAVAILEEPRPSLAQIGEAIRHYKVTTAWMTAGLFHLMVDHRLDDLKPLRQLLAGGDVLSVPHVHKLLKALPATQLINGYGPTENTTFTCCHPISGQGWGEGSVPIGKAISHTQIYILDDDLQPVADGEVGQLCAGGDGVAAGYLQRPELTAEKFRPDPFTVEAGALMYLTGDLVRRRPDGLIEFLGRKDRQVKIDGKRVELDEIEAVLRRTPGITDAVVVLQENDGGAKQITAFLKFHSGADGDIAAPEIAACLDAARSVLPAHMMPVNIRALKEFPLNPQGKVDRKALCAMGYEAVSRLAETPVPRDNDEITATITAAWREVLKIGHVPIDVNFFDLGGTSLKLIQLHELLQRRWPELSILQLFEKPTIGAFARQMAMQAETAQSFAASRQRGLRQAGMFKQFRAARQ